MIKFWFQISSTEHNFVLFYPHQGVTFTLQGYKVSQSQKIGFMAQNIQKVKKETKFFAYKPIHLWLSKKCFLRWKETEILNFRRSWDSYILDWCFFNHFAKSITFISDCISTSFWLENIMIIYSNKAMTVHILILAIWSLKGFVKISGKLIIREQILKKVRKKAESMRLGSWSIRNWNKKLKNTILKIVKYCSFSLTSPAGFVCPHPSYNFTKKIVEKWILWYRQNFIRYRQEQTKAVSWFNFKSWSNWFTEITSLCHWVYFESFIGIIWEIYPVKDLHTSMLNCVYFEWVRSKFSLSNLSI